MEPTGWPSSISPTVHRDIHARESVISATRTIRNGIMAMIKRIAVEDIKTIRWDDDPAVSDQYGTSTNVLLTLHLARLKYTKGVTNRWVYLDPADNTPFIWYGGKSIMFDIDDDLDWLIRCVTCCSDVCKNNL